MITFTHEVDGDLVDADSVKLSDPLGEYGLRRSDINEVLVADDTPLTRASLGTYTFDTGSLGLSDEITYDYWIEVEYDNETSRYQKFIAGASEEALDSKILRLVVVKDGEYVELESVPRLSSPTGSFGVSRLDTGEKIVSDGSPYRAVGNLYLAEFGIPLDAADSLKYRYYAEIVVPGEDSESDVTYYVPRTTEYMTSANLIIGRYTDSIQIGNMFGFDNVHKWVALDEGDEAVDYAMRQWQYIYDAESLVDDLVLGYYIREEFSAPIPRVISQAATMLAGCLMYEARGVTDRNPVTGDLEHKYAAQRRRAEQTLRQIKYGKLKLNGISQLPGYPEVLSD